mmetsp:Transcript_26479/g.49999  ORF Transcript_26479/g.49999 Transcript_26479/m.49999 type:complete len:81 (-) Transcript_26479:1215-1457(-)
MEAYYNCALRCDSDNPVDATVTITACQSTLEQATSCINTDCSLCISTSDSPSTCQGIAATIDTCDSCSDCAVSITALFSC